MSEGYVVQSFGDQLGQDGKEGRVFQTRTKKRFRATVLNHPVSVPRGTLLAVKQFRKTKSPNRILREAVFQQRAAALGVAPIVMGVHTKEKYIAMEKCDARVVDVYAHQTLPADLQKMICALMQRLDDEKILHNDGNALNLLLLHNRPVLIDYGFTKALKRGKSNINITMWMLVRSLVRYHIQVPLMQKCINGQDRELIIHGGEKLLRR